MPTQTEDQRQRAVTDAGVSPQSLPAAPASAPINVAQLQGTVPFTLPPAPALPTYDLSTLPPIETLANPGATPAEQERDALGQKVLANTAKLGGKAAAQIKAEDAAGLPVLNKSLIPSPPAAKTFQPR